MQKSSFSLLILLLGATSIFSQKTLTMKGLVVDREHNEALIGAIVILQESYDGRASTAIDGTFKINSIKALPWEIVISYTGYHNQIIRVENPEDIPIIKMEIDPNATARVIICPLPPPIKIATRILKGRVIDKENNTPLIATTVSIESTDLTTVTDLDGFFELEIPSYFSTETLVFSYHGYPSQQMIVKHFSEDTVVEMSTRGIMKCRPFVESDVQNKKRIRSFKKRKKAKKH